TAMNCAFLSSEPISTSLGRRAESRSKRDGRESGNKRMTNIEQPARNAAAPNVARDPMLSARMPPIDGPHTEAAMIAPTKTAKLRTRLDAVAFSSTKD